MRLTDEQEAVVEAALGGRDLKVQAFAGSGKTATLAAAARALRAARPRARILYLTFNRALALEARARLPGGVRVLTNHGLAFAAVGAPFAGRLVPSIFGLRSAVQSLPEVRRLCAFGFDPDDAALTVLAAVEAFLHSADPEPRPDHVPLPLRDDEELVRATVSAARLVFRALADPAGPLPITHDVYLKLYQLSRPRIPADVILFDEAQDANPAMLDILLRQPAQLIFVGDDHQQIYGFRGAVDGLSRFSGRPLYLTRSFRFGREIAGFASTLLRRFKGETRTVEGNPLIPSRVGPLPAPDVVLTRTNAGAVLAVLALADAGFRVGLAGPVRELLAQLEALRRLRAGAPPAHPDFAPFRSFDELVRFVRRHPAAGRSLAPWVRLAEAYGDRISGIIRRLEVAVQTDPQVLVSTAHRAKGREWDRVRIGPDFHPGRNPPPEEVNLAYVAATRARRYLDPGPLRTMTT